LIEVKNFRLVEVDALRCQNHLFFATFLQLLPGFRDRLVNVGNHLLLKGFLKVLL